MMEVSHYCNLLSESESVTPGLLLRQARIKLGLTREEVAKRLCLFVTVIRQLEQDDYSNTDDLVYVKGYLKSYARLLHIAPTAIMQAFDNLAIDTPARYPALLSETSEISPQARVSLKFLANHRTYWFSLIILLFMGMSWWYADWNQQITREKPMMAADFVKQLPSDLIKYNYKIPWVLPQNYSRAFLPFSKLQYSGQMLYANWKNTYYKPETTNIRRYSHS